MTATVVRLESMGASQVDLPTIKMVLLGDVVEFLDHKRRPITAKDRIAGLIPYYGANGQQDSVAGYIFDEPLVLLAEDGGHFDHPSRGIAYRVSGKTWVNNHAHVLRPTRQVDVNYLARVLQNYDVRPFLTGTTRSKLTKAGAQRIPIPLLPLEDQRRVANILDKADELRSKRRQALAQLDTLTQSVFHNMFRDAENLFSLGEYVDFRYGTSNKSGATGVATLRIPNIVSGSIDLTDLKVVPVPKEEEERLVLRNGDLLFVRSNGNPANVGRCAVFDTSRMQLGDVNPRDFIYASYLIRARMRKPGLSSIFLQTYLSSAEGRAQLLAGAKTSAGQYNINTQALANLKVPIASLEQQTRFEKSVSGIELLRDRYTAQLAELDALFASLQHRAFSGQL